jgi:hypothetical protein
MSSIFKTIRAGKHINNNKNGQHVEYFLDMVVLCLEDAWIKPRSVVNLQPLG